MKKLLTAAIALSACVAMADAEEVQLGSDIGVNEVTSTNQNTIIAVSFTELAGGDITVSNFVKTTNLTTGDKLYTYDGSSYDCWVLTADPVVSGAKYWAQMSKKYKRNSDGEIVEDTTAAADVTTRGVCEGIWLVRENPPSSAFKVYVYGKIPSATNVTVTAGATKLVGNPLASAVAPTVTNVQVGDQVSVPAAGSAGLIAYTYKTTTASGTGWYYTDPETHAKVKAASFPAVDAGTGFWYKAKNSGNARVLSWE